MHDPLLAPFAAELVAAAVELSLWLMVVGVALGALLHRWFFTER
jgi:hypothetical protein